MATDADRGPRWIRECSSAVHVGDCRLHLIRHSHLTQISKDHTMVADRVRMGVMSAARAKNHPERGGAAAEPRAMS